MTNFDFNILFQIANKFVTRTCLTTYTYLTTYLENGSTTVKSHEQVISNTATEERNSIRIVPTPTATSGITLTQVNIKNRKIAFL